MNLTRLPESAWIALLLLFLCCVYPPAVISEQAANQTFLKGDCVYRSVVDPHGTCPFIIFEGGDCAFVTNAVCDVGTVCFHGVCTTVSSVVCH